MTVSRSPRGTRRPSSLKNVRYGSRNALVSGMFDTTVEGARRQTGPRRQIPRVSSVSSNSVNVKRDRLMSVRSLTGIGGPVCFTMSTAGLLAAFCETHEVESWLPEKSQALVLRHTRHA